MRKGGSGDLEPPLISTSIISHFVNYMRRLFVLICATPSRMDGTATVGANDKGVVIPCVLLTVSPAAWC